MLSKASLEHKYSRDKKKAHAIKNNVSRRVAALFLFINVLRVRVEKLFLLASN